MQSTIGIIDLVVSVATAIGVIVAAWQLALSKGQARTDFEDNLNMQYREISRRLPINALLGDPLTSVEQQNALEHFYHYFDLSNEQAFLRRQGRIRKRTWEDWREGITQNLHKPAFVAAWVEITKRSPSFNDLKELVPAAGQLALAASKQVRRSGELEVLRTQAIAVASSVVEENSPTAQSPLPAAKTP